MKVTQLMIVIAVLFGWVTSATIAVAQLPQAVRPAVGPMGVQLQAVAVDVTLKHGSCGPGCSTHVLAAMPNIPTISYKIGMFCPMHKTINYLAYHPKLAEPVVLVAQDNQQNMMYKDVQVTPFNSTDLVKACRKAYGGEWSKTGLHPGKPKIISTELKRYIYISGSCSGWTDDVSRSFPVTLTVDCHDDHEAVESD